MKLLLEFPNALKSLLVPEGFVQIDQGEGIEFENRQQLLNQVAKLGRRASKRTNSYESGDANASIHTLSCDRTGFRVAFFLSGVVQ